MLNSPLTSLPFDLKDVILSFLVSPHDLLSFALTSSGWKSLIVPYHIEYRQLRIPPGCVYIWHHLAERKDLCGHIRTVHLMSGIDGSRQLLPTTLVKAKSEAPTRGADSETEENGMPIATVVKVIQSMTSLRSFTCHWTDASAGGSFGELNSSILIAMERLPLEHLYLGDPSRAGSLTSDLSPLLTWKPDVTNLTRLTLRGLTWVSPESRDLVLDILERAQKLEDLTLSHSTTSFPITTLNFPMLRKLHLWPEGLQPHSQFSFDGADDSILSFISAHPWINDLRWYPVKLRTNPPRGFLPSLKRILSNGRFVNALLRDASQSLRRPLEVISQISVGEDTKVLLRENVDGRLVKEVHVWRFGDLEDLRELASMFPNITTLEIPVFGLSSERHDYQVEECIDCLAEFTNLEYIRDCTLWLAMSLNKGEQGARVEELARKCPKLHRINHWRSGPNGETVEVVIERNGDQLERSTATRPTFSQQHLQSSHCRRLIQMADASTIPFLPGNGLLECLVIPARKRHSATVFFLHGLGDTAKNIKQFLDPLICSPELDHVKFILPTAPRMKITGARLSELNSWFDCYSFNVANRPEDEEGLKRAAASINALIVNEVRGSVGIPTHRIVIGGISQGGATAMMTALTSNIGLTIDNSPSFQHVAGLFILSSYIPLRKKIKTMLVPTAKEIPIFWAHGDQDKRARHTDWLKFAPRLASEIGIPYVFHPDKGRTPLEKKSFDMVEGLHFYLYDGLPHWLSNTELGDLATWVSTVVPADKAGERTLI